jgi:hypothetical protein
VSAAPVKSPEARASEPEAARPSEVSIYTQFERGVREAGGQFVLPLEGYEDGKMICRMVDGVMHVWEDEAAAGGCDLGGQFVLRGLEPHLCCSAAGCQHVLG